MGFDFINKAIKKYTSGVDPAGANETFDKTTVVEYGSFHQSRSVPPKTALCLAPWVSINFTIDGFANVCCLNRKTAVDIKGKTINEIWQSEEFRRLRESVAKGNLSYDCSVCKEQIDGGNFAGVKAISYDPFYPANLERPKVMEFCLDNTCNLACTMCNSVLSSTIRKKQNLPDFVPKYDDDFVQQLEEYIPFLESVVFSGGEPFLTPIYFKIWEKIIAIKPNLTISVVTNGTTLNSKIKNLLERGRFKINVSLDSVDKNTYESIRQNATFERVMENFAWFQDYGARKNLSVNIPVCVLTLNWQNIPDIIRFANEKDVSINFVYVDRPISLALVNKPAQYLEPIIQFYNTQQFELISSKSKVNVSRFHGLISDLVKWKESNSFAIESAMSLQNKEIDYLSAIEQLIFKSEDVGIKHNEEAQNELLTKITMVLNEVEREKWPLIYERLSSTPMSVIYSYIKGKSRSELLTMFSEYTG